jgi:kinesin family protein 5
MIEERIFDFDRILSPNCSQSESYDKVANKVVSDVLQGYNGTIMAYGQVTVI